MFWNPGANMGFSLFHGVAHEARLKIGKRILPLPESTRNKDCKSRISENCGCARFGKKSIILKVFGVFFCFCLSKVDGAMNRTGGVT